VSMLLACAPHVNVLSILRLKISPSCEWRIQWRPSDFGC
jgi:hypothetical protein